MAGGNTYAKGTKAWGLCKRCGLRFLLNELVFDSQIPWLRVCTDCWDPKHPQERAIKVSDPQALWRPSPEGGGPTAPVLSGILMGDDGSLSWTAATVGDSKIKQYVLYRAIGDGEFLVLQNFVLIYAWDGALVSQTLTYMDSDLDLDVDYSYYIEVADENRRTAHSNVISLDVGDAPGAQVLSGYNSGTVNHLSWTEAVEGAFPIVSYRLYNAVTDELIVDQAGLTYDDTGVAEGTYSYYVLSIDTLGNLSARSNTLVVMVSADADFASVVLLLHGDGADGQTVIIDSSFVGNVMTAEGDARLTTANKMFGTASMRFDGSTVPTGAFTTPVTIGSPLDILNGTDDFTIEGWFYINSFLGVQSIIFGIEEPTNTIKFRLFIDGVGIMQLQTLGMTWEAAHHQTTVTDHQWYHFAVTKQGTTGSVYLNGIKGNLGGGSGWLANEGINGKLLIGASVNSVIQFTWFDGELDDIRITKGVCRYTANFTPPTSPYPDLPTI